LDLHELPADAAAAMRDALADEALDPSYAAFVVRHLPVADAAWRWCCGSNCDPCVQRLGRVVDRVRAVLCTSRPHGNAGPGLPGPGARA
jgi:hypothetical protein